MCGFLGGLCVALKRGSARLLKGLLEKTDRYFTILYIHTVQDGWMYHKGVECMYMCKEAENTPAAELMARVIVGLLFPIILIFCRYVYSKDIPATTHKKNHSTSTSNQSL